MLQYAPDTAPHPSGLGGRRRAWLPPGEAADEKEPGQLARALTLSYSGCGQGFAPCMISLIFSRPSESRYLHRVRLLSRPLPSVYLFRHRIPIQLTVHLDGDRANPDPSCSRRSGYRQVTPSVDRVRRRCGEMRRYPLDTRLRHYHFSTQILSCVRILFSFHSRFILYFLSTRQFRELLKCRTSPTVKRCRGDAHLSRRRAP